MVSSRHHLDLRNGKGEAQLWGAQGHEGQGRAVRGRDQRGWDSDEFRGFMNRRASDIIYLGSGKFGEFMEAGEADNGLALKIAGVR